MLIAKGGGLDDRDAFVENCRKANISADEALEVAKWEFNPGMSASQSEGPANTDGADEFNEMFWRYHPHQHPQGREHRARLNSIRRKYWTNT
jgi:hypothetical protein